MLIIRWAGALLCALAVSMSSALAQNVAAPGGFVPQSAVSYGTAGSAATAVDPTHPLPITAGSISAVVGASFSRPADTTAYALGDLVANSTTAGSVTPVAIAVARANGGTGSIVNIRLSKSGTSLTNAQFRVHLFKTSPTVTNGDNGAFLANGIAAIYIGYVDVTMDVAFSDGAKGSAAAPTARSIFIFDTGALTTNLYALVEARAAYTPVSGETFTVTAEVLRD